MPSISYAITACNEHEELARLLTQLDLTIADEDEIIVQLDTNRTQEVLDVVNRFNVGTRYQFHRIHCELNNDFAAFKNNLLGFCSKDYIFFIDADEYLPMMLLHSTKAILEVNPDVDCISVPRVNIVRGLEQKHIDQWCWSVNEKGWVNWPDYQTRICKRGQGIKWVGHVHERLEHWKNLSVLPPEEEWALQHPKSIEKQIKQNGFYDKLT